MLCVKNNFPNVFQGRLCFWQIYPLQDRGCTFPNIQVRLSNALKSRYQTQIPTLPTFFSNIPAFIKNEILGTFELKKKFFSVFEISKS